MDAPHTDKPNHTPAGSRDALRGQALRRLKNRRDFRAHLSAYLLINVIVWGGWVMNGLNSGRWPAPWPVFLTFGWGIVIAFNAYSVYHRRPITENDVRREMEHHGRTS
jgi:hypothetical protein